MSDSTFRVNFGFTADTAQAKTSLQDLQIQLDKLIKTSSTKTSGAGFTKEIQNAVSAAAELKAHLQSATNVQTGVLDFSKLSDSLSRSNKSLMDYGDELLKLGPAGEESFKALARSVASSEIPLKRTSKMVNDLWISLKNAARWQISASVLHGFMGALQTSYHYAQDLNESLNNIRIVTGQSTEQMAKFAEQANKTARSLSASTLDYTNASLIYYQQGLDDQQVQERTNATIKMANVTGQNAQEVSDQMTAVWNNFDNGSKSLEYYADVMTALGAATASSTDEIATGLEKFAAVSETVGLSYEYATAALATVTATTRQNADIVGNAFKTLFARIQGLKLGETLDDGTTLNKYSDALNKVGISIMDQNGELRDMDAILNDMGAKWDTLDKAQQTALAQTVAGVRQYTQLIALMDNWDFFQENLGVAYESEGTLNEQAEIYAESWEAAEKRVQAAAEAIYQDLLDDEFFIDLTKGAEGFLIVLDKFIDGIGGVKGVLLGLGAIATKVFQQQIASGLNSMVYTIKMSTEAGQKAVLKQRSDILKEMSATYVSMQGGGPEAQIRAQNLERELQLRDALAQKIDQMNSTEQLRAKELLNIVQLQGESVVKAQEEVNAKKDQLSILKNQIKESAVLKNPKGMSNASGGVDSWLGKYEKADTGFNAINNIFKQLGNKTKLTEEQLNNVKNALNNIGNNKQIRSLITDLDKAQGNGKNLKDILVKIRNEFETKKGAAGSELQTKFDVDPKILQDYLKTLREISQAEIDIQKKQEMYQKATDDYKKRILEANNSSKDWATTLVSNANKISMVVFSFQSLSNVVNTLKDPDTSGWDKLTTALIGISSAIPGIIQGYSLLKQAHEMVTKAKLKELAVTIALHWQLSLIIGILTAVGIAIYAVTKAYNADADAAKEAAEAAQQAKDSFEGTKSSVDELKSSLSNIDESHKSLENMTKGTDEWREAVTSLNDEVLKLIDAYPELAAAVKETDGVLSIDKTSQAYKDFLKQQDTLLEKSRQSYLGAAINANQKQDQADITSFKRKINSIPGDKWVNGTYGVKVDISSDQLKSIVQILQNENNSILRSKDVFKEALIDANIGLNDEDLIQALYDNKDGLIDLSNSLQANKTANGLFNQQIAQSYLQDSFIYQTSSNQASMEKALAEQLSRVDTSTWGTKYGHNNTDAYVQDLYAGQMGWTKVKNNNNGTAEYLTASGESITKSDAEVRYWLNLQKFLEENETKAKEADEFLSNENLQGEENKNAKALIDAAIAGDYSGLTEDQLAMELGENESVEDWLKNMLGGDAVDKATKLFGEDFIVNLEAALKASADSIPEDPFNLSSWTDTFKEIKDLNIGDTIDPEVFNSLNENMKQFFTETIDGTYMLTTAADQLTSKLKETLTSEIQEQQGRVYAGQSAMGDYEEDIGKSGVPGGESDRFNYRLVEAQLAFLKSQGKDISEYNDLYNDAGDLDLGPEDIELVNQLAEAAGAVKAEFDGLEISLQENQEKRAMSADTVDELDDLFSSGTISQKQRDEYLSGTIFKEAENLDIDYQEVQEYGEYLRENVKELENNVELSERLALNEKKQLKGLENLIENYEEYSDTLKTADKTSEAYSKALNNVKKDVKLLLATNHDFEDEFFQDPEVLQAIEDVSNGVDGAYGRLEALATKQIMIDMGVDDSKITQEVLGLIADLSEMAIGSNFVITPQLDNTNALDGLYDLLTQAGLTATQIMDIFREIGWEPKLAYETMDITGYSDQESFGYQQVAILQPDGSYAIETMDLAGAQAIAQDGKILVPKIVSATKVGGGGVSAPPPINRGGGGGGGGSKRKPPQKKSDIDKERYHTVTNQLEDLKSEYEDIAEASDRAFGQDKLDNMDAEISKTDELIAKQKEYLAAIEANLPVDRDIMTAYYNQLIGGPGIEFDEKGNIANFDAIQDAMYSRYNANTTALGEEQWEIFEEKYKKLEDYIKQYEETYDLLRDEEQEYQDLINQRLDAQLEKIEYEVDLKLNISDDALAVLEFQLDRLEDDAFKAAETIALQSEKAEKIYDKVQFNQEGIDKILKNHDLNINAFYEGLYSEAELMETGFTENEIETIKEYRDNLLDLNNELLEVRNDVQEKVMETFDAWNEKLQDGIDKFDHYNSVMENYRNIIDIVGKDYLKMNNQMIKALNQAMIDNSINKVKATKDAYDAMVASQASAQAAYEDALKRGIQQDIDYWKETLEQIGVEVSDAKENMMQAWEDALQSAADAFELAVESAVDNFEKALLPFGTLDEFSEAYDKQQEVADQYLDDYQKIYELSKLSRDINNSLDDTKIIGGKQKLKDLLEDINDLQEEGVEMSEYDLEYLQKTYDLRMAEIELEQAQRAKDTVRLTRDNEGNWSYAYTTDTSAVDDAAQKYEDALYAMQDLSSNYIDEMSEQLISTSQEMEEALAAIRVEDYASIEEYYKKLDEIQQYYLARMKYMQDEMQQALNNNKDLYEQDWKNYSDATGYKISDNEDFMMSYKDTVLGSLFDSEDDIVDFQERVNDALGTEDSGLIGELLQAYEQWSKNTDDAMMAAGSSSEGFAEDMADAVEGDGGILDQSQSATDAVDDMANQMVAGFDSITTAVDVWQSHYSSAMEQVIKDNLDVIDAYNLLLKVLSSGSKQGFVSEDLMNMAASIGNRGSSYEQNTNSAGSSNASSTQVPIRFASGGYTGEWGPDGKWALLDEKEMVLNANDTSNLLTAVNVIQDILKTIDLNAQFATNGLGALTAGFIRDDIGSILEQNVHISAEFPNVQDHNEVELALSNLINTASQYANRKE